MGRNIRHIGRKHLMMSFKVRHSPDACCPGFSIFFYLKSSPQTSWLKTTPTLLELVIQARFSQEILLLQGTMPEWRSAGGWSDLGGLNLACPGPQWGWWGGGWFHRNGHLELLHAASPAWQFTLMNLKVIRDLKLWLGAPREGCSSE